MTERHALFGSYSDSLLAFSESFEFNYAVGESEQSIVGTFTDIFAGVDLASSLSYENVSGQYELTVGSLNTKTF